MIRPALLPAFGCQPEQLGQCDLDEASMLVVDSGGSPAYAGQALVHDACAGCHAANATPASRRGAPAGLDFDTVGSRTADISMVDLEAVERLRRSRQTLFDERHNVYETVLSGTMPPGEAGRSAYLDHGYVFADGTSLPPIESVWGREILRGWLACGAPMVAVAIDDDGPGAGTFCDGPEGLVPPGADEEQQRRFACVRQQCAERAPTWSGIFADIIVPQCVGCHSTGTMFTEASDLDLCGSADTAACDPTVAHGALVGVPAGGTDCVGVAADRVISGMPDASYLVHKIEGETAGGGMLCGAVMPIGAPLSSCHIDRIRQWVALGAPND